MLRYIAIVATALSFVVAIGVARAGEWGKAQYAAPDIQEYYATLKQPDAPNISCCGDSDAYYADKTDFDPDGALVAIITDTRPDELVRPDGSKVHRRHIEVGTRIRVPPNKIRKHSIPNPTDHTLIFVGTGGDVYCYEPQPLI
jgi:hypothetical protein